MTCGCEMSSIVSLIDVFAFVSHVCGGDMIDDRAGLIPSVCGGVDEQFSSFFVVFAPAEALFCVQAEPARSVEDRVPAEQRRGRVGPEAGAALALQLAHPRAVLAHARHDRPRRREDTLDIVAVDEAGLDAERRGPPLDWTTVLQEPGRALGHLIVFDHHQQRQ